MKVKLSRLGAVLLTAGAVVAVPQSAEAVGCASLVSTHQAGNSSTTATVKNVCGHSIVARATVPFFPDSGCATIAAGQSRVFRTGGIFSPRATGAVVC
jgi:hypothetical protein